MAFERRLIEQVDALASLLEAPVAQTDDRLLAALEGVGAARRLLDAVGAELAGEVARRCQSGALAARQGEKSASAIVAARAGIDPDEARDWCLAGVATAPRLSLCGEQLPPERPALAHAFASGEVTVAAVARVARSVDEVERRAPGHATATEQLLVAQIGLLTPRQLRLVCTAVIDHADPEGVQLREDELRRRSGVEVSRTPDGLLRWNITMHPEAAGFLSTALDARTAPRREPSFGDAMRLPADEAENRTLAQRRLDALVSIARESLEHDAGSVAGTAVTMVVTVPLEVLTSGLGAARITGVESSISASTARRLAAQAELIPAVLGGPSEPLDLGRAERLFSPAQRRALALRDGGCLWPRCAAPPGWCEVAHVEAWEAGGVTDLSNGMLLCPYHHRRFDLDGWSLLVRNGERYLVPPRWVDADRRLRRIGQATGDVVA